MNNLSVTGFGYNNNLLVTLCSFTDKELDEFLENMESKQFQKISNFFDTMPRLRHNVNFNCVSCSKDNSLVLEGLDSFFG